MVNYYEQDNENESSNDDAYGYPPQIIPMSTHDATISTCPFSIESGILRNCLAERCMAWQKTESVNDDMGICSRLSF